MHKLTIEVVSDVVCPWCFIGEARLEDALSARPDIDATVRFLPFQLDPAAPAGGTDLRERLQKRYGVDPSSIFARVEAAARETGIPLDFAKVTRAPNTLSAQTLVVDAESRGTQHALVKALFRAYFLEGLDVGDPDVLARIASEHGYERDEARMLVTDDVARERVKVLAAGQSARGVSGVPFFIFDERLAVSGAQPVAALLKVLDRVVAEGGAER